VGGNVLNGVVDAGNLISLGVGNFNGKLILDGHHDLDGVQRIQAQIVGKLGRGGDLGGVDLVKVLYNGNDAVGNLSGVNEGLKFSTHPAFRRKNRVVGMLVSFHSSTIPIKQNTKPSTKENK